MKQSPEIKELSAALAAAQAEMPSVPFDATNPFLKNKYASLGAVIEHSRPVLAKHGLAITQFPVSDGQAVGIESVLTHQSGQFLSERLMLDLGEEKGKSRAQVAGSILSYLRRYSWSAILGMYADEDTDAEPRTRAPQAPYNASQRTTPSTPQPAPAAPPQTPQAPPVATPAGRNRMLDIIGAAGLTQLAAEYANKAGILLETENLQDWPLRWVPTSKAQMDALMAKITDFGNGAQAEKAFEPNPEPPPEQPPKAPKAPKPVEIGPAWLVAEGTVEQVSEKHGDKGDKPWTLYGVKVAGEWHNTFSDTYGAYAKERKGAAVKVWYETTQRGRDLKHLE